MQKELDLQREMTKSFGKTVTEAGALIADRLSEEVRRKKYEAAVELEQAQNALNENNSETNRTLLLQAKADFDKANQEAQAWETGGSQRQILDSALNILSTALAGRPAAEVIVSGLSPTVNQQIKEATTDKEGNVNSALNLTAHALWGAVEAYAGNRNIASGAAGAVTGEAAANLIAKTLYGKTANQLTQEEKATVSTLSQIAAGVVGGTAANSSDGAMIAAKTAKEAVENNYLYAGEAARKYELMMLIQTETNPEKRAEYQKELDSIIAKDIRTQKETEDNCPRFGKGSSGCQASILDAEKARQSYNDYTDKFQPLGYSKEERQYKNIFGYDYGRTNEALVGKDPLTLQKEAFAVEVAKAKNTLPEQEYNWVSNGIDLGKLGEFQGWGRAIKGLPKVSNQDSKVKSVINSAPAKEEIDYSKDVANLGKNNAKFNQELNENISAKPAGVISNINSVNKLIKGELPGMSTNNRFGVPREMAPTSTPNETAKDFINKYIESKKYELFQVKDNNGIYKYDINGGVRRLGGETILYRPAGNASRRTTDTTATVEINSQDIRNINGDKPLKFPVKSEVK